MASHRRRRECDERRRNWVHATADISDELTRPRRRRGVYDIDGGAGGAISLSVGDGNTGPGRAVTVTAGKTTADSAAGGADAEGWHR